VCYNEVQNIKLGEFCPFLYEKVFYKNKKEKLKMIRKLQGQKARIAILITLIVTSLVEVLFRAIVMKEAALGIANAGEQVAIIVLAAVVLLFMAKKNDKLSYVACGALVAYFVMDQLIELPGMIGNLIANVSEPAIIISVTIRLLTMVGIVAIAALLAEYVNDGSIYNRAFNVVFWITIVLHVASIAVSASGLFLPASSAEFALLQKQNVLIIFNEIYRIVMVVLFTSFAYDSAKRQLNRENLTK
jgi:hypothetical protein